MAAQLGNNLIDRMSNVCDRTRLVQQRLGLRQWRVATVRKKWSGARKGQGSVSVTEREIEPRPLLVVPNRQDALHLQLEPHGKQDEGLIELREVSLSLSEADLTGGAIAGNEEWYFRVWDGHGQQVMERYYVLDAPPIPDRDKTIGWVIKLRRVEKV